MAIRTDSPGETPNSGPVRVAHVTIKNLFGSHTVDFDLRLQDRVTILHGRNGSGKTATLSILDAVLMGTLASVENIPFEMVEITFSDGSACRVKTLALPGEEANVEPQRSGFDRVRRGAPARLVEERRLGETTFRDGTRREVTMRELKAVVPWWVRQLDADRWVDEMSEQTISTGEILAEYGGLARAERGSLVPTKTPVQTYMIKTQRLLKQVDRATSDGDPLKPMVQELALEVRRRIAEVDTRYRTLSTELDDSLPRRMFTVGERQPPTAEALLERNSRLEKERARLRTIGLLADSKQTFSPEELDRPQLRMFSVYLDDNEQKLGVFKELADRAEVLLDILNRKFTPKRITLDKSTGYHVRTGDGRTLSLDQLSSGEQHELVLLHHLLFNVEPGTLLLIDEPELSLHVTWQSEFLADLMRVAAVAEFDAILATHSPYIVADRRDLLVQLGAPEVAAA